MNNTVRHSTNKFRLGIGSFSFRYAVGFNGFKPEIPMDTIAFLEEAKRLGFQGVQLCENLKYASLNNNELLLVKKKADELGLFLEIGMNNASVETLNQHLYIAKLLSSNFLRVVLGGGSPLPEKNSEEFLEEAIDALKSVLPACRELGVTIGIENHFDLPSEQLLKIVETLDDESIGLIFDTTNALGFAERPEETMDIFKGHIVSVHLKDYEIRKVEAGYMMTGTILGEGNLKTEYILDHVIKNNPVKSVIMEMTTRRQDNLKIEDVIRWEKDVVEKSTLKLFDLASKY